MRWWEWVLAIGLGVPFAVLMIAATPAIFLTPKEFEEMRARSVARRAERDARYHARCERTGDPTSGVPR